MQQLRTLLTARYATGGAKRQEQGGASPANALSKRPD